MIEPLPIGASPPDNSRPPMATGSPCLMKRAWRFGQLQAQHIGVGRDLGDGLARHDHCSGRDRNGENPAIRGREHLALLHLLGYHLALGFRRLERVQSDFGSRPRFVELGAGRVAFLGELLLALPLGVGGFGARFEPDDLRIERSHPERELLIGDGGEDVAHLHLGALGDGKRGDGAAGADAGADLVSAAHRGEHRLEIVDTALLNLERIGSRGRAGEAGAGQDYSKYNSAPAIARRPAERNRIVRALLVTPVSFGGIVREIRRLADACL